MFTRKKMHIVVKIAKSSHESEMHTFLCQDVQKSKE